MCFGVIISPCYGIVDKITINRTDRLYEWETLFSIKTDDGPTEMIQTSVSGEVESIEVQEGDNVIPGMVLAYIKEDMFVTGSD
ncbi:biotin/lipoyl-binding protein [Neobacillus massiliamazoniensis]|jgi:biotin carboxyl carrier protein|uniref:Putative biotin carboxyl carrier protein n=1 Tax=Neobacillus massiliamazoniensis TaxID=1499688 RepID=A0A0U1NUK1_9BACI|nr:biotin/lipoyl-binding protein [Neobacillus massiliamazoniensis]CRK81706.1 putative biotin carboxyl carrier protein [Neobacillus massiliamazoniensis]